MANLSFPFTKSSLTDQQGWYKATMLQKIVVEHWYYRDNRCNDFEFIPTGKTQKILKRYALNVKSVGNEYQIIVLKELEDEIISDMQHEKLEFYIQLKNPYFTNFTALLEKQYPSTYYFFQQEMQRIKQEEIFITGDSFEWTFTTTIDISQLMLNFSDTELKTISLLSEDRFDIDENGFYKDGFYKDDEDDSYHVYVNMSSYKAGVYSLSSKEDQSIAVFLLKTENTSLPSSLFGLIQLNLSNDVENPTTERIQFYPRRIRWQYNLYKSATYQNHEDTLSDNSSPLPENQLDWEKDSNIDIKANGTIKCTKDGDWGNSGTYSSTIAQEEDVFISASLSNNNKSQAMGLSSKTSPSYHYNQMDVGLLFENGNTVKVIEKGKIISSLCYDYLIEEDTFCIVKVGSWAYYEKNGETLGRFNTAIDQEVKLLVAFRGENDRFTDVYLHNFSSELPNIQFTKTQTAEKTVFKSERWLPYKQRSGKTIALDLEPISGETLTIALRNPSGLELEKPININI